MLKDLYGMIDELHIATQGIIFAKIRYQHAMDELTESYCWIKDEIGKSLADALSKKINRR